MGSYENERGKTYARDINKLSREINRLIIKRKLTTKKMNAVGWTAIDSARDPGYGSAIYFSIIKQIRRDETVRLEV